MRTTVDLDPTVLERAKRLALSERRTLGAVVNDAIAAYVGKRKPASKDPPFELLVRGTPSGHANDSAHRPTEAKRNSAMHPE